MVDPVRFCSEVALIGGLGLALSACTGTVGSGDEVTPQSGSSPATGVGGSDVGAGTTGAAGVVAVAGAAGVVGFGAAEELVISAPKPRPRREIGLAMCYLPWGMNSVCPT